MWIEMPKKSLGRFQYFVLVSSVHGIKQHIHYTSLGTQMLLLLLLSRFSRVRLCATPQTAAHQASRPWDSPGKNTGVGFHFLLQCMKVKSESEVAQSCLTLATPWTAAYQAPLSMGFSRQKYWSRVPLPSPRYTATTLKCAMNVLP